jgi:uncharacterized membrane protein YbhN (UPF0104 family)
MAASCDQPSCPDRSRRRLLFTVAGALLVSGLLAHALAGRGADFAAALHDAPAATLAAAVVLQICALVARSEAWNVCVSAAGGDVQRRRLYRAASIGYVGNLLNGQFGVAARIAALRRSAPTDSPPVASLITAELPILSVEAGLAALTSFTLVGPMGLPWWTPLPALAVIGLITVVLGRLGRRPARPLWRGLAAMGDSARALRIVGVVLIAVFAQIARNWLVLHALGIDASVFDSIAVLIAMVTLSQLPVGPSVGAAATVAVLGPHGLAIAAAAGVLLTATGTVGSLCYAGWAAIDRFFGERIAAQWRAGRARFGAAGSRSLPRTWAALGGLPTRQRRKVEVAYFGGLGVAEMRKLVWLPVARAAPVAA